MACCIRQRSGWESNPRPLHHQSDILTLRYGATPVHQSNCNVDSLLKLIETSKSSWWINAAFHKIEHTLSQRQLQSQPNNWTKNAYRNHLTSRWYLSAEQTGNFTRGMHFDRACGWINLFATCSLLTVTLRLHIRVFWQPTSRCHLHFTVNKQPLASENLKTCTKAETNLRQEQIRELMRSGLRTRDSVFLVDRKSTANDQSVTRSRRNDTDLHWTNKQTNMQHYDLDTATSCSNVYQSTNWKLVQRG